MKLFYWLLVFYLTVNLFWALFRGKKGWSQVSIALILILFILRLFLVQ